MKEIKQIVARISGHRNRECYTILCYAVEAARHYQPQEPKMKVILADVVDMMEEKKRTEHAFQGLVSSCSGHLGAWGPSRALESVRPSDRGPAHAEGAGVSSG